MHGWMDGWMDGWMYACIYFQYLMLVYLSMNYFCCGSFEIYEQIFQEYLLDNSVFRLVAILTSINKIFEKQLQRNPFLR